MPKFSKLQVHHIECICPKNKAYDIRGRYWGTSPDMGVYEVDITHETTHWARGPEDCTETLHVRASSARQIRQRAKKGNV